MKTTAEYRAIVEGLRIHQRVTWSTYLSNGYDQFKTNSELYKAAADAIEEFIDRENRRRENERRPMGEDYPRLG